MCPNAPLLMFILSDLGSFRAICTCSPKHLKCPSQKSIALFSSPSRSVIELVCRLSHDNNLANGHWLTHALEVSSVCMMDWCTNQQYSRPFLALPALIASGYYCCTRISFGIPWNIYGECYCCWERTISGVWTDILMVSGCTPEISPRCSREKTPK